MQLAPPNSYHIYNQPFFRSCLLSIFFYHFCVDKSGAKSTGWKISLPLVTATLKLFNSFRKPVKLRQKLFFNAPPARALFSEIHAMPE